MPLPPGAMDAWAPRRQRFLERGGVPPADPVGEALLGAILASGEHLTGLLLADVSALPALVADPFLRQPKPPALLARAVEQATAGATDFADFQRRLRVVRRREVLRLGARELGFGTTEEVARELSAFADACLEAAVAFGRAELRRRIGEPHGDDRPAQFVVMAMGKLGGEELNFSSDIDICYFYSTDAGGVSGRDVSLHAYYAELSRMVTEAIEEPTADGAIFRVDLRLRPEGRNGPLCNSLAAAERYYETFGRTWERQAWLRARPAAGDLALGDELIAMMEPFVYPRRIEPDMLDEVRALRAMFRDPADAGPTLGEGGFDVKLGSGGIRDVELVVQTLQLLHGGKRPDIRERSTPRALRRLVVAGLLAEREAQTLSDAYRFWRRLEHRVQMATGAQQHRLPAGEDARARFAAGLGFPDLEVFDAVVARAREGVDAVAGTFADPEPGPREEAARLMDPQRSRADLERLAAASGFRDVEAAAGTLETTRARLPLAFVEQAIASPDPDRALAHFRDLALHGSVGLMALLRTHPNLVRMMGTLFGTSDTLSDLLLRHPEMWEPVTEGLGDRVRSRADLGARLARHVGEIAPGTAVDEAEETQLRAIRRFQAEEILRVGLHDVAGSLDAGTVSAQLTDIAELCLQATIVATMPAIIARQGAPRAALTVLGLGSLGSREMRYGSDLDLVFLFGSEPAAAPEARQGSAPPAAITTLSDQAWFGRASQRIIAALEVMLEEGRLYRVDTRLRPSGEQGLLVTSYDAFERYHRGEAAGWERVALLRARVVYTAEGADRRAALERQIASIAFDRPFDDARFRADLRRMRDRLERERGTVPEGSRHLRFDPGGIMDVEFLVALGQLQNAADPGVRTTSTAAALERLAALGWPSDLRDDYLALRAVALRLRLLLDRPGDVVSPRDLSPLARTLGTTPEVLAGDLDHRRARVRAVFNDRFG
jgi:[glutamine synthetase] adenylyltransferase / [glutamine synthetase]-adenylyl-L-tyrosine phosphorylase